MTINRSLLFKHLSVSLVLIVCLSLAPASTSVFASNYIERISVGNTPIPPEEELGSTVPAVSSDGRFVIFQSDNIYAPTNQNCEGLYRRDRLNNVTEHVNLNF